MAQRRKMAALILVMMGLGSHAAGAQALRLQFRPPVGQKQTLQVTSHVASVPMTPIDTDRTERHWILTMELEPLAVTPDGNVTFRVTLRRIQHKLFATRKGREFYMFDLDSADEKRRNEQQMGMCLAPINEQQMGMCLAPIGESFTVVVSAQGRIQKLDTEAFCAAVARKRMQYEDEAIRRETIRIRTWAYRKEDEAARQKHLQADADSAVRAENRRFGSAAKREQLYRDCALEFHLYSLEKLRRSLLDVLIPFPDKPLGKDGRWIAPVMMRADGPIELEGTYTVTSQDSSTCTIQVEARRTMEDQSLTAPEVPEEYRTRLAGTYHATLKIDRTTGMLLSKESSMDLTGRTSNYMPDIPSSAETWEITVKATTSVEVVH
jgi:hypothetical protein